jgi:hypothetical protein
MLSQLDCPLPLTSSQNPVEMQLPLVVNEALVHPFKYWNEKIQQGIRYNNELYALFQTYSIDERLRAYEMAYEHAEQGAHVCITVSKTRYSIWLNLRFLSHMTDSKLQPVE